MSDLPHFIPQNLRNCVRCREDFPTFGREYICPKCRAPKPKPTVKRVNPGDPLSLRQQQVLELLEAGLPDKEIAFALHLTPGTVKEYMIHIRKKTGTSNRVELAVWWVKKRYGIPN